MKKEQGYKPDSREGKRAALLLEVQEKVEKGIIKGDFLEELRATNLMNASMERNRTPEGKSEIKIKLELGGHPIELIGTGGECVGCAI